MVNTEKKEKEFMNEFEASAYLELAVRTLRSYRTLKKGPAFYKKNMNVLYSKIDLDAFKANRQDEYVRYSFDDSEKRTIDDFCSDEVNV